MKAGLKNGNYSGINEQGSTNPINSKENKVYLNMKKINRIEFLKQPVNTIYSKVNEKDGATCYGLFKKCNAPFDGWGNDWLELELVPFVCYIKCPDNITNGVDIMDYGQELADSGKDFELDYTMIGRDGFFNEKEMFVVWDKNDINKLIEQLKE